MRTNERGGKVLHGLFVRTARIRDAGNYTREKRRNVTRFNVQPLRLIGEPRRLDGREYS